MNLPRLSVRNPVAVNLVMLAIITSGAYAWIKLIREFFPNMQAEQVVVTVLWPGATPEEVEKSITKLVEREIEDVEEIERIESDVFEGISVVRAELEEDANRDRVLNDIRGEIDKVKPDLPDGAEEPEITEMRPMIPVIGVVLHGKVPESVLHDAVLDVRDDLVDLPEVTEVLVTGFRDREFIVEILPERLETYGLTFEEVGRAVAASNVDVPGGQLKGARTNIRVRTVGERQVARRLEDVVVRMRADGSVVRLRDVAVVRDGFEDKVERGRFVDKRQIAVVLDPKRVAALGLTRHDVVAGLRRNGIDLAGTSQVADRPVLRVRTMGDRNLLERLPPVVVRDAVEENDGKPLDEPLPAVTLREVAAVGPDGRPEIRTPTRAEVLQWMKEDAGTGDEADERAASIMVFKTPEQDAIEIANAVKRYVADLPDKAGGALKVSISTDLARFIEQRLDLMKRNARAGLIFVLLTLAIFLELRIAFWVMVGLVVSFAGTFMLMLVTGATINLISMFGLIVVLGLIVDDAIVIGENVFTKLRQGNPPQIAAERGATEVAAPVLAAVLTTCVAFVPLAWIEGRVGEFLGVLPIVVICALCVSLIEGFYILPAHLLHVPKPRTGRIGRAYDRFNEAKHHLFEQILPRLLERQLRFLIRWRYAAVAISMVVLLAAAGLLIGGVVPFVLLQDTDAETVTANIEMSAGTPEEETLQTLIQAEQAAAKRPEVGTAFTVLGVVFGDHGMVLSADPATVGQVTLELVPAEVRQAGKLMASPKLVAELRKETANIPGAKRVSWRGRSGGPGGADIEVLVRADDLAVAQRAVAFVRQELASFRGVDEIYDDLTLGKLEARLRLLPSGRLLGLTTQSLAMQVRHGLFGIEAQDLQIGDEEVTVRVMLPEAARASLADLRRLRIATPDGARVPLEEVAAVTTERGYASIMRVDGKRAVTVTAEVDADVQNTAEVTTELKTELLGAAHEFPGVEFSFEGQRKETMESLGSLAIGFPAAILAIFTIIAIVFRSYTQPVIVMIVIPYALVGAIVGHLVMGYPFTILSMIGSVALSGIVVNDGLILVDYANRARRAGRSSLESVVTASKARLRPILLTSITTIAGLAPLMLERSFQAQFLIPMAVSIVFGLAFATALTLMLLPLYYMIFEDAKAAGRWLWNGRFEYEGGKAKEGDDVLAAAPRS